jgi:hypothetical protein
LAGVKHSFLKYTYSRLQHGRNCTRNQIGAGVALPFLLLLSAASASYGGTVNCSNSGGDAGAIQSNLNGGGTTTINGTCAIGGATLTFGSNITINGSATLNYTGGGQIFQSAGSNNTITGLTMNGGGVHLNANSGATKSGWQSGWTITNNTIQNVTSGANAISVDNIIGNGNHSTISNNTFINIWSNGYPNTGANGSSNDAIFIQNGIDNLLIDSNKCYETNGNCIKGFTGGFPSQSLLYVAHNVVISNNDIQLNNRIGIEFNGVGCFGACNYGFDSYPDLVVKGNYWHNPVNPIDNQFAFSLVWGIGPQGGVYNNSAVDQGPCGFRPAIAYELDLQGGTFQGNVAAAANLSPCNPNGWASYEVTGFSNSDGNTNHLQNNVYCGANIGASGSNWDSTERQPDTEPRVFTGELAIVSTSCPTTSGITLAFSSANNQSFPGGGNGTWSATAVSNLSIRNVSFYVDGSSTPVAMQEIQDVNTNFSNDRKWHYHATFNTSSIASGTHTLTARATDVSGAPQSVVQTFTVGYGAGTPSAQATPSSISFGTEIIGLKAAPQTVTLKNAGTAALTISGMSVSGANANDFSSTSACGGSLAAGASCTIGVGFTPSATGSETASLVIGSNASGSPQSIPLSGNGGSAPPPPPPPPPPTPGTLPTNLPQGMNLWLANDIGVVTTGSAVSVWEDQSGTGSDAIQSTAANRPTVVPGNNSQNALHFDGVSSFMSIPSVPIDGLTGMTVFMVSANSQDVSSKAGWGFYSLLSWPETAPNWGETFFGSYQMSSHFRFGTMQIGNENSYQMLFTRTNSFGLSEWMHAGTTDSLWFNGQNMASYTGKSASIAGVGASALLGQGVNKLFYPGDVSEIIVYTRSLASGERQAVEQYLMTKYHL